MMALASILTFLLELNGSASGTSKIHWQVVWYENVTRNTFFCAAMNMVQNLGP